MNTFATYRTETGKTLSEVAREFSVSSRTILRWEQGRTDIPLKRLAEVSRVTGIPQHRLRPDLAEMFGGAA